MKITDSIIPNRWEISSMKLILIARTNEKHRRSLKRKTWWKQSRRNSVQGGSNSPPDDKGQPDDKDSITNEWIEAWRSRSQIEFEISIVACYGLCYLWTKRKTYYCYVNLATEIYIYPLYINHGALKYFSSNYVSSLDWFLEYLEKYIGSS